MNATEAKRIALLASVGAGAVTIAGNVAGGAGKLPNVTIGVAALGVAVGTTALAEVAPQLAAAVALTVLLTSLFALSDAPWQAIVNVSRVRN